MAGRPVVAIELRKLSPAWASDDLADLAELCENGGADALVIPTDAEDTSTGLADLLAVCRRVRIPVARRDWILHPIQVNLSLRSHPSAALRLCQPWCNDIEERVSALRSDAYNGRLLCCRSSQSFRHCAAARNLPSNNRLARCS